MSLPALQQVDLSLDVGDPRNTAVDIVMAIRPDWSREEVQVDIKKGAGNNLVTVSRGGVKLMVRGFGDDNPILRQIFHRDSEVQVLRVLSHQGLVEPLYARFNNGVVYGYAEGDILHRKLMQDDNVLSTVCRAMHAVHQMDVVGYIGRVEERPACMKYIDVSWDVLLNQDFSTMTQKQSYVHKYKDTLPPLEELSRETEYIRGLYDQLCEDFPVVYCHGDAHAHNTIYNTHTGKASFVDWECSGWYPEIWDPTVLFERTIDTEFTDAASRRHLVEVYLRTHPTLGKQPIKDQLIDAWNLGLIRATLISKWFAMSIYFALTKTHHMADVLYDLGIKVYKIYQKTKEELNQLEGK